MEITGTIAAVAGLAMQFALLDAACVAAPLTLAAAQGAVTVQLARSARRQLRRRNPERECDLPKPRLDHPAVARSHAQELPLGRAQFLEPFISIGVADPF